MRRWRNRSSRSKKAALRLEACEERIVFDQSLAAPVHLDDIQPPLAVVEELLPAELQFRDAQADFEFSSSSLSQQQLAQLISDAATASPADVELYTIDDQDFWRKAPGHYSPSFREDGVFVAEHFAENTNAHTMLVAGSHSDCFHHGGLYTYQDYHYQISFEIRHPTSELSWLNDHAWGVVMQLWGPREAGESARNPPFSIYTTSIDGEPHWVVKSYGDSRLTTQSGDFEQKHAVDVPMTGVGDWHRFDIEFVPNPFGQGLVRTWLDGDLIAEWIDIQNIYYSMFENDPTGPLNAGFGIYSSTDEDGMEVHFDNISVQCNGTYSSSISGVVTGLANPDGALVYAVDQRNGETYAVRAGRTGVYTLSVPRGIYTIAALHEDNGWQAPEQHITTYFGSTVADHELQAPVKPKLDRLTLTGDVTGDGKSDIVNRLADGTWQVSAETDPQHYQTTNWGRWSADAEWQHVQLSDFTGDGMLDIVGLAIDGTWWVATSTGTEFTTSNWGRWSAAPDWGDVLVGDFNGDGLSDVAGRDLNSGKWWVSNSIGTTFETRSWGIWSPYVEWTESLVGDFNGDGLSDLAGRNATNGDWWVSLSTGETFQNHHWGVWSTSVNWQEVAVGDFNGDGRSDIVGRTFGTWWVARSHGHGFQNVRWGAWSTLEEWSDISVTDVNGDGLSDLVGRADSDGSWWSARSTGRRFLNEFWGAISAEDEDWLAIVDDFDGDGRADLLRLRADGWWLAR